MRMLVDFGFPVEPFKAEVRFRICMTPEELAAAGLEALGEQFG